MYNFRRVSFIFFSFFQMIANKKGIQAVVVLSLFLTFLHLPEFYAM